MRGVMRRGRYYAPEEKGESAKGRQEKEFVRNLLGNQVPVYRDDYRGWQSVKMRCFQFSWLRWQRRCWVLRGLGEKRRPKRKSRRGGSVGFMGGKSVKTKTNNEVHIRYAKMAQSRRQADMHRGRWQKL